MQIQSINDKYLQSTITDTRVHCDFLTFSTQNHLILTYFTHLDTTHFFYKYYDIDCERDKKIKRNYIQ